MTSAKGAARTAQRSDAFRRVARAGFVVVGLVHIIIGAIAVSIATGGGGDADQDGAMEQIRSTPVGGLDTASERRAEGDYRADGPGRPRPRLVPRSTRPALARRLVHFSGGAT